MVSQPGEAVVAPFHDNFRPGRGHDGEQSVGVNRAEWRDPLQQSQQWLRQVSGAKQAGDCFRAADQQNECGEHTHAERANP